MFVGESHRSAFQLASDARQRYVRMPPPARAPIKNSPQLAQVANPLSGNTAAGRRCGFLSPGGGPPNLPPPASPGGRAPPRATPIVRLAQVATVAQQPPHGKGVPGSMIGAALGA